MHAPDYSVLIRPPVKANDVIDMKSISRTLSPADARQYLMLEFSKRTFNTIGTDWFCSTDIAYSTIDGFLTRGLVVQMHLIGMTKSDGMWTGRRATGSRTSSHQVFSQSKRMEWPPGYFINECTGYY